MTNTERDKAIWEGLGECWHVLDDDLASSNFGSCLKCKAELLGYASGEENPDFTTDSGKVMLLREMMKLEDFHRFVAKINGFSLDEDGDMLNNAMPIDYITDTTGKFALEVYDWFVRTGRIK